LGLFSGLLGIFGKKKRAPATPGTRRHVVVAAKKKKDRTPRTDVKDRFDLEQRLGQGSMSKVFRARDRRLGRIVCLKILDKDKTARFDARFIGLERPHEGMVSTILKHKNCVKTYEWGITKEGEIFLVMELIEGLGLNFLIETNARQLQGNRFNFLCQAAEGLHYIHDRGFMHRDICPRNMMVTAQGVLKLIDFGLTIPNTPDFHKPGNRTGTANYMAPELIKRVTTDHRVDLFALGVTAYEIFTARLPWEGVQSLQAMQSHINNPGRDPREANPALPDPIAQFLMKAIERDPRDRFQNALELRDAARSLSEQFPL
jgi:serine/threonine protein kinase